MTKIKGEKSTNSLHAFLEFFVVVFISIVNPGAKYKQRVQILSDATLQNVQ